MSKTTSTKTPMCAFPKCRATVRRCDYVPLIGESSGRIFACDKHRATIEMSKAIIGTAAVAGFREGMDRAFPGVRERIGALGMTAIDLINDVRASMAKGRT